MIKMFVLFVAASIGMTLRWVILGEYEPSQLLFPFLFLLVSPLFLWISIRQKNKDAAFSPIDSSTKWTTSLKDKWLTGEKKIFQEGELIATYTRVYSKKYHKIVADLMRTPGLWFLQLAFRFKDGRTFTVTNEENWKGNARYTIWESNSKVGEIRSNIKSKHIKELLEHTVLEFGGHIYEFRARTIRSHIEVLKDGDSIGDVERKPIGGARWLNLNLSEVNDKNEPFLLMSWIVFSYRFDK